MNGIYSWAISFVSCSFIVLIINYLFPKGNVKNTATVVLVLFCIVTIINPFKKIKKADLVIPNETYIQEYSNNASTAYKTRLRLLTDEALKSIGIDDYELRLDVSINDNVINIESFTVTIEDKDLTEKARTVIAEKTGIEPEISLFE